MSAVIIDARTGQATTRPLTADELAQQQADQAAAAQRAADEAAAQAAQAAADAQDSHLLEVLYPQLAALIDPLRDPQHAWTAADLAPILGNTLDALKGIVDRMRRKGL